MRNPLPIANAINEYHDHWMVTYGIATFYPEPLRKFLLLFKEWSGNPSIGEITPQMVSDYNSFLHTAKDYRTRRPYFGRVLEIHFSASVTKACWRVFKTFWNWAASEYGNNPTFKIAGIEDGQVQFTPLTAFSRGDLEKMLTVYHQQTSRTPPQIPSNTVERRDVTILTTLMDTGIYADEVCRLTMGCVDPDFKYLTVIKFDGNTRKVPMTARMSRNLGRQLFRRYRQNQAGPDDPLFVTEREYKQITLTRLGNILNSIGKKAGVENVTAERFRHTLAANFLENGGTPAQLEHLLGHGNSDSYIALVGKSASPNVD